LSAGRFYAILRYVEAQKRLHEPRSMQLTLSTPGTLSVQWGDPQHPMGGGSAGPGNPLPSVSQKKIRG